MRQTSREAFDKVMESGFVSKLEKEIYAVLWESGPLIEYDVWKFRFQTYQRVSISPIFARLHHMGIIHEVGTEKNRDTGMTCTKWDVTDRGPVPITRKPSTDEILNKMQKQIDDLTHEINRLKGIWGNTAKNQTQLALF